MIGFFDSGLGGLTVIRDVLKKLPKYDTIYLGDTARTPYGNRSMDVVYRFTQQAVDFLFAQGCELVIVACSTASAEALRKIQQEHLPKKHPDKKVLGVIRPLVEKAAEVSKGKVGVIGTRGTIASEAYVKELAEQNSKLEVLQKACPLLVPLVEDGMASKPETTKIIRGYLRELKAWRPDTLILGCTHYPMLAKQIKNVMGQNCNILDSGKIVAESLAEYLERHPEIEKKLKKGDVHKWLVTDKTERFAHLAEKWLGRKVDLEQVNLEA